MPVNFAADWIDQQANRITADQLRGLAKLTPTHVRAEAHPELPPYRVLDGTASAEAPLREFHRRMLGDAVAEYALAAPDRDSLTKALRAVLPEGYPRIFAAGSTRDVYALPLGLVMKVERPDPAEDPLEPADLVYRGGEGYIPHLAMRRRSSNLAELSFAITYPNAFVNVYGAALSFGAWRPNPGVLVVKQITSLYQEYPDKDNGVPYSKLALDREGKLHCFDRRFHKLKRSRRNMRRCDSIPGFTCGDTGVFLGNIGRDHEDGSFRFMDRGGAMPEKLLDRWDRVTFCLWSDLTIPGSAEHQQRTANYSTVMMQLYRDAVTARERRTQ